MNFHIYKVLLRRQMSPARLLGMAALSGVAILLGVLARTADNTVEFATQSTGIFGINVLVPFMALSLGSAALGDLVEDRTLVYVWLRPVPRYTIATAAVAAVISVVGSFAIAIMTAAAAITEVHDLILATVIATALAVVAYSGLFVALGLRFERSLLIGLGYIAIWELLLSRLGDWFARLSVRSYPMSVLADATGVEMRLADRAVVASYVVPVVIGLVAVVYTSWHLTRTEID
ncbi:MAG: hypothetical protein F4138_07480 [Acidimicrobiia bacterium]|nr:hypothetical protein [Acidimicrobiia bacterium]MYC57094.1 hypothetical protein [Acidimicrobiia bacterium]MYG94804.1 hypothetical protein [Acidimicrobiia bacterium]MYI30171.1 hypothetical protein [Acidimicrobiia bacterium]